MAFPVLPASTAGYQFVAETANTTAHTITYPTGTSSGDLFLAFVALDGNPTLSAWPSGWSQLKRLTGTTLQVVEVWGKVSDGTETGSFDYTSSASEKSHNHMIRLTTWFGSISGVEVSTGASATSTTPDADNLAPSWGSADTKWVIFYGQNDPNTVGSNPAGYTDIGSSSLGGTGSVNSRLAHRDNAASSENAAAWGATGASDDWNALTVGVRPASAGGATEDPFPYVRIGGYYPQQG